jgi:hypothetical protein
MGLRDQFADAVDTVFFGAGGLKETVSFHAVGASASNEIDAIAEDVQEPVSTGAGFDGEMLPSLAAAMRFFVPVTEVAAPGYGDEILREGTTWRVRQIATQHGMHVLYCVGEERMIG